MKRLTTAFWMAWGMFFALPCPCRRWDEKARGLMLQFFPLIGLLIGGLWWLLGWLLRGTDWALLGWALLAACPWLLSGMIHVDGFMDCCDAVFSRRELSQRQQILKDPTAGAFAVMGFVLLALFSCGVFSRLALAERARCLLFLPPVSRCVSALAVQLLPPLEHSQYAGTFRGQKRRGPSLALAAQLLLFLGAAVLLCGRSGLSAVATALCSGLAIWAVSRNLGGMSGDISGFGLTVGEFCGVLSLLFL